MESEKCLGHKQINKENFPFYKKDGKIFIEMEDCGEDLQGKQISEIVIKYCPVCGSKI